MKLKGEWMELEAGILNEVAPEPGRQRLHFLSFVACFLLFMNVISEPSDMCASFGIAIEVSDF